MRRPAILTLLLLTVTTAYGQYSIAHLDLEGEIGNWYDSVFGANNPELYEGALYELPTRASVRQHPFLGPGHWELGAITFRDETYDNIAMLYDLINGQLILRHPKFQGTGLDYLQVNQDQIGSFDLLGHYFEHFYNSYHPSPGPGFYEILYEGSNLRLIAQKWKEEKTYQTTLEFKELSKYFMEKDGAFIRISSKSAVYNAFPTHKKSIKAYLRRNRLKVKLGDDASLTQVMMFCDELDANP